MKKEKEKERAPEVVWEVKGELESRKPSVEEITSLLLENRGLKSKKEKSEFLNPKSPEKLTFEELSISEEDVEKAVERIKKAKENKEKILVYGDYDADGICGTAVLWETLYFQDIDAIPHIPERFSEGYGLNEESLKKIKEENPELSLVITVDNGITATKAVEKAEELGLDVIVTDHHKKGEKDPDSFATIHTTEIGGAGLAWILSREVRKSFGEKDLGQGLDLVAIGTVADQLPLLGPNRSLVKYGLTRLSETTRPGLNALFEEASVKKGAIGTYVIGFIIAPRLNAMGRLEHAIDSLRLLCTTSRTRAEKLARKLGRTNTERQKVVKEVLMHARESAMEREWKGAIVISHESYHEGVIGLAASKLVEEFNRPAIVMSEGDEEVKGSARSLPGFNIIEAIREAEDLLISGGGHPMAAGFSIKRDVMEDFAEKMEEVSAPLLTDDVMRKVLKVDMEIEFDSVDWELYHSLQEFEPTGIGNPTPSFITRDVGVVEARAVGKTNDHLKLKLKKGKTFFNGISFGKGELSTKLPRGAKVDVAYSLDENFWNGRTSLEVKVKDLKIN